MKNFKREERETADKIKKLDFSCLSKSHKDKLREQLLGGNSRPLIGLELDEDELGAVAGGIEVELELEKKEKQ